MAAAFDFAASHQSLSVCSSAAAHESRSCSCRLWLPSAGSEAGLLPGGLTGSRPWIQLFSGAVGQGLCDPPPEGPKVVPSAVTLLMESSPLALGRQGWACACCQWAADRCLWTLMHSGEACAPPASQWTPEKACVHSRGPQEGLQAYLTQALCPRAGWAIPVASHSALTVGGGEKVETAGR